MFERFKNESKPQQETKDKKEVASAILESAESILAQEKSEAKDSKWFQAASTIGIFGMSMVMLGSAAEYASGGSGSGLLASSVPLAIFTALEVGGWIRSEKILKLLKIKKEEIIDKTSKEQNTRYCLNCGKKLNQDVSFRYNCGEAAGSPKTIEN
ncbi:MAG: hypothetical protein M1334_04050 [Patescibacteria group bacterium]|nr:hypothetical protein [Patescibacteria group bacterium]